MSHFSAPHISRNFDLVANFLQIWHSFAKKSGPAILVGLVVFRHRFNSKQWSWSPPFALCTYARLVDLCRDPLRLFHGLELMIEGDFQFTCWNFCGFHFRVNQHTREKCENLHYQEPITREPKTKPKDIFKLVVVATFLQNLPTSECSVVQED